MAGAPTSGADGTGNAVPDSLAALVVPKASAPTERRGAHDGPGPRVAEHRYEVTNRPGPPPVPNGWYAAVRTAALEVGGIHSFVAVERDLVAYRDESGSAHVVDAYCPHLGAHLGGGMVVEDSIKCPYHGWRFGPDGRCVEVPYHDGHIPPKACVPSYPVCEQDGFVYFWFHHAGRPPAYELPRVEEVGDPGWSDAYPFELEIEAALAEMAENNVDYAHLRYVHRRPVVPNETSTFTTDGPFSTVVEQLPEGGSFSRQAWGPGVALLQVPGIMTLLATTTPIDRRHCRLQWHFHFPPAMEPAAEALMEGVTGRYGLQADLPIWRDKAYLTRPALVRSDGHIAEFRRWYRQFFEDAPDQPDQPT